MTASSDRTVAIVGGGISGLALAESIQRQSKAAGRPVRPIVLEADATVGGKVRSFQRDGFVIETGPHGFLGREPSVFELIDRLGIRDELLRADPASARRYLVRRGRLNEVKMSPPKFMTSDLLSIGGRMRIMMEPFIPAEPPEDESVRDFAKRRIGKEAAEVLVDAMVTGIYGGDPAQLSLQSAFPRMLELEKNYGSLIKAQFALAKDRKEESADEKATRESLHSFKSGLQVLIDGLARAAPDIRTGHAVEHITPTGRGVRLDGPFGSLHADAVISTAPAPALAKMVGPYAPPAAVETAGGVPYAPVTVVVLAFGAEDVQSALTGFGYLAPFCEDRNLLGCVWASSVFPEHAPAGYALFRCMLGGVRKADLASMPEDDLIQVCREELEQMVGLKPGARLRMKEVIRWPEGIPQYNRGHHDRVQAAESLEQSVSGLVVGGNAYRGVAMIECVKVADPTAERALTKVLQPAPA